MRAMRFFFGQVNEFIQMPHIAILQQGIEQHRAQCGCKSEREMGVHAVTLPTLHNLQERHIGFRDGFEEPVFFQKFIVLRMPYERQVRVEDQ